MQAIGLDVSHGVIMFMFYMLDTRVSVWINTYKSSIVDISAYVVIKLILQLIGSQLRWQIKEWSVICEHEENVFCSDKNELDWSRHTNSLN